MTDEEKAKRIAFNKQSGKNNGYLETYLIAYESAMEMSDWKEKEMIEKSVEWLRSHWREYVWYTDGGIAHFGHWEKDFRKAMEE